MSPDLRRVVRAASCAAIACLLSAPAVGQYAIDWYTVDGGGEMASSGGSYTLSGQV